MNTPDIEGADPQSKLVAVVGLVIALGLGAAGWVFLGRAADTGVERLARIDKMRALCTEAWQQARTESDSARVDKMALPDTIDPQSERRIARCGLLRGESIPNTLPNPREMSGEPMPRGLR